jgi:hypothetical protein
MLVIRSPFEMAQDEYIDCRRGSDDELKALRNMANHAATFSHYLFAYEQAFRCLGVNEARDADIRQTISFLRPKLIGYCRTSDEWMQLRAVAEIFSDHDFVRRIKEILEEMEKQKKSI